MATQEIYLLALAIATVRLPAVLPLSGYALLSPYNQDIPKAFVRRKEEVAD